MQEDLENADIATPMDKGEQQAARVAVRGRLALRRLRLPNNETDQACVTPRLTSFRPAGEKTGADTFRGLDTVRIVDPSDGAISYRLMTGGLAALGSARKASARGSPRNSPRNSPRALR